LAGAEHPWRGPGPNIPCGGQRLRQMLLLMQLAKRRALVCVREVWESRDEILGLPYGDDAAPCSGQLSRTLLMAAGKHVSGFRARQGVQPP